MRPAGPLGLALACAMLAGCASTPRPSDAGGEQPIAGGAAAARSVVLCATHLDALRERLGPPSRDGVLGRLRVLTWIVDWEPLVRYLGVAVDDAGRVVDVVWDLPTEVPWVPVDRCLPAARG